MRWFQVYVFADRAVTLDLVEEACAHGYSALVLTVDTPFLGRRERDIRVDFKIPEGITPISDIFARAFDRSLSWRDLEWLSGYGVPVVVKGILTAEDARLACEHGAAAIVVSNHGGRQLDPRYDLVDWPLHGTFVRTLTRRRNRHGSKRSRHFQERQRERFCCKYYGWSVLRRADRQRCQ